MLGFTSEARASIYPWSDLGGSHGFQLDVAWIKSAAPSFFARARMLNGVSMVVKVVAQPFLSCRAS